MKKHILIRLLLTIIIIGVGFRTVRQQQDVFSLRKTVGDLKEEQKKSNKKEQQLISENECFSDGTLDTTESLKEIKQKVANDGIEVDLKSEYTNIVTKLFEANLNFTPENYENRKKEVSNYLSDELSKDYFGQKRETYQDVNGTTSKLESIEIYLKAQQNNEIVGIVVVDFKSKQGDYDWIRGMNVFKVAYDNGSKRVKRIVNLGSGYSDG